MISHPVPVRVKRGWRLKGGTISPYRGGISIGDRGFRYGQHVFESLAVRNGKPLLILEHLELLAKSANSQGIPFTPSLAGPLLSFLRKISLPEGMLRIYLTAGEGAPAAPILQPNLYLSWEPLPFPTSADISAGIRLITLKNTFPGRRWGIKSGNYEEHLFSLGAARTAGADEGIVVDQRGRVLSCAMGNLLLWLPTRSGIELFTPPPAEGARSGTLLGWVRHQTRVQERKIRTSDLGSALSMAVTNSRLGVMPVVSLDGRKLPERSLARLLADDYLRAHGLLGNS